MKIEIDQLSVRVALQAMKIWRGDFPKGEYPNDKPGHPSMIWQDELTKAIDIFKHASVLFAL